MSCWAVLPLVLAASVAVLAAGSSLSSHICAPCASCRAPSVVEGGVQGRLQPVFLAVRRALWGEAARDPTRWPAAPRVSLRPCRWRQGETGGVSPGISELARTALFRLTLALQASSHSLSRASL